MSSTAQQFDFPLSKEELVAILQKVGQDGLRIDYVGMEELCNQVTRINLHHRMSALTYGDKIAIDLLDNGDGSVHMNIVSSNIGAFTYGVHSKNISAIANISKGKSRKVTPVNRS